MSQFSESRPLRLGLVTDFPEERWESMDLVAEMVAAQLQSSDSAGVVPVSLTPRYRRFFGHVSGSRLAWNLDRFVNRRWTLPRGLRRAMTRQLPDAVFVVDHSYAHVVPAVRSAGVPVVVLCHDLDAFSAILDPQPGWRARLSRWFARPIRDGLLQADHVITVSDTVRKAFLDAFGDQVPSGCVTTIPNGVADEFRPMSVDASKPFYGLEAASRPLLLHVGSTIPRKRIDVLLNTLARLVRPFPGIMLARIGGPLTPEQSDLAENLGLDGRVLTLPRLSRAEVAEAYRRADAVLVTSDAEGFGLPVAEALACGASVVASDIAVLRETGGPCVRYAKPGDAGAFAEAVTDILKSTGQGLQSSEVAEARQVWVSRFRWDTFAAELSAVVRGLVASREA